MKFTALVEETEDGGYQASCEQMGVSAGGLSPAHALDRLRAEIQYRLELCPCTSVDDDFVELETGS